MAVTLVQEWINYTNNANAATSKTATPAGGAEVTTTAGNHLIARLMIRDESVTAAEVTDNASNTWTLLEEAHEASISLFVFHCPSAAATSSVTATWTDASEQPVEAPVQFYVSEFAGVGDLINASGHELTGGDGGQGGPLTPTGTGQLLYAAGAAPNTNRTWAPAETNITMTQLSQYSGQQLTMFGAYGLTDGTDPVSAGWDRTAGSSTPVGVVVALFEEGEAGPTPLSVNAGADQSIYVGQTASVSASASGGTGPYTYAWTVVSGSGSFLNSNQASTTFTPSGGAGTRVLRCIVTDANSTVAQDDLTVTVSQAPEFITVASVNDATGWTPTGGTVVAVLSDTSDSTLITSIDNPTEQTLDVNSQPITISPGQHFVARVRARRGGGATTGTITGHLYVGSTLHSTVEGRPIPGSMGDVDITFPANDIADITPQQWADGVRFVAEVTASS